MALWTTVRVRVASRVARAADARARGEGRVLADVAADALAAYADRPAKPARPAKRATGTARKSSGKRRS